MMLCSRVPSHDLSVRPMISLGGRSMSELTQIPFLCMLIANISKYIVVMTCSTSLSMTPLLSVSLSSSSSSARVIQRGGGGGGGKCGKGGKGGNGGKGGRGKKVDSGVHKGAVRDIIVCGDQVFTASSDRTIRMWKA